MSFLNENKAHVVQTAVILAPTLGAIVTLYVVLRTDITKALEDNVRQDAAIAEIRQDNKMFAAEQRNILIRTNEILTKVQIDTAANAASAAATAAATIAAKKR